MNSNFNFIFDHQKNIINRLQLVSQRILKIEEDQRISSFRNKLLQATQNASASSISYKEKDLQILYEQNTLIRNQVDLIEKYLLKISTDKMTRE